MIKLIVPIFINIWYYVRQLKAIVILLKKICNNLAIVVTLNCFYKDFFSIIVMLSLEKKKRLNKI